MWEQFRRKLTIAAAGRNLAIDLSLSHGAGAVDIVAGARASTQLTAYELEILERAAAELDLLWPSRTEP